MGKAGFGKRKKKERSTPENLCGGKRIFDKILLLEFWGWEQALGRLKEGELEGEDRVADSKSSPELCLLAHSTIPNCLAWRCLSPST